MKAQVWSTASSYWNYIEEARKEYLAEYFADKAKKAPPPKPLWNWRVNQHGTLMVQVRKRKPAYVKQSEYDLILKEMLTSGKDLTEHDLQSVLKRRNIEVRGDT